MSSQKKKLRFREVCNILRATELEMEKTGFKPRKPHSLPLKSEPEFTAVGSVGSSGKVPKEENNK